MKQNFLKNKGIYIFPVVVFGAFALWWLYLQPFDLEVTRNMRQLWGATYQILALYGGLVGLFISRRWGGYKSLIGKIILVFSLGLLLQVFGQSYSSYYVFHYQVESPPYPAIGDIGFFGSVIAYICGIILLAKAAGVKNRLKATHNKFWAFAIPFVILFGSYWYFLRGYEIDPSNFLLTFLDFGYPLGQAFYVSVAVLALVMSRNILGGIMKKPIWFLIFALIFQYLSDTFFLYQAHAGTWYVGNINDFLYCASYFIMGLAIISMGSVFNKIQES
jgi:hypothetical protein